MSTWREGCRPIIEKVLKDTKGQDEKEIRKALKEAYPYGTRKYHPYKIWLDEIKRQRGLKKLGIKSRDHVGPNQINLF
jgi:hypothetical protein